MLSFNNQASLQKSRTQKSLGSAHQLPKSKAIDQALCSKCTCYARNPSVTKATLGY